MRISTPVSDSPDKKALPATVRPQGDPVPHAPRSGDAQPPVCGRPGRDGRAAKAMLLLGLLIASAVFAPLLAPHGEEARLAVRPLPPSFEHPFGTDDFGRDVLARVMRGGRISLAAGILATSLAVLFGLFAGAVSGYRGGIVDSLIMRTTDFVLSVPAFFVILLVSSVAAPGFILICALIAMTQWMDVARIVRSVVLKIKQTEFIEAARALGASDNRILWKHILCHTSGPVRVAATIGVAQAIMTESALSFLGFGVQPPSESWGGMLTRAQSQLGVAPWLAIFPGAMIFLTVLSCYALGDFLRSKIADRS
jgi:peptide/nickel transport system permease protein